MIAMKHDPQPPIRPRQRGAQGALATTRTGHQPKRVVIRVPFVETGMPPSSTRHTTPERPAGSATATPSKESANVAISSSTKPQTTTTATPVARSIRIDAAHEAVPAPHATTTAKASTNWLAGVLQKKTLLALGLIISILVLAVVIHQRPGHESSAESTTPHQKFAKSERHASLARKSQVDNVAADGPPANGQPRHAQSATGATTPIVRQSLGTDFTSGPALLKGDAIPSNATANSTTGAATNAPAMLGGGADTNAASNELLVPKMHDLIPPREALAPPANSGTAEAQYFGFAPGEGTSPIAVAARGGASFEGAISNSPISAPVLKK
jgi:hypothetical protein